MHSWITTVDANRTVRIPAEIPTGEQILLVRMPSISSLLNDPERRRRFAATRKALKQAVARDDSADALSNEEIVAMVKRARNAKSQ